MRNIAAHLSFFIDHLVRESAAQDKIARARHRFFVAPRLVFAGCALLGAPLWIFLYGPPSPRQALIFLLAQTPLVSVAVLARTGRFALAQSISLFGWLAMAAALHVLHGADAAAAVALMIALSEAALAPELFIVLLIESAAIGLAALAFGFDHAGPDAIEQAPAFLVFSSPLLFYAASLATCAARAESGRAEPDRASAPNLRLLTGALGDVVLRLDRGGAVTELIGDAHRSFGLERGDLLGRGFFQRVHIADRAVFLKLVSDAAADGEPLSAVLRVQLGVAPSASGDYAEPIFNDFEARIRRAPPAADRDHTAQEVLPLICVLRDVAANKRAERAIAAAQAESARATEIKARFLANVSHELRTPLNAIIGFSEMLADPALAPADPVRAREYATIVANSGNHLLQIVNTILDMSKIEAGAMQLSAEPFSLPDLIDQCCDILQLKADEGGVRLLRAYPRNIAELIADKRACKQILLNLLSNAVKFTPPGGRVEVRAAPEGNSLALIVADTGIGIAATDLSRLGDPFFQASATHDRTYEGTGLGLSIVRGLVGLHGGTITIESAPGKGAVVTVRLPLDCRAFGLVASAAAKIETIPRQATALGAPVRHIEETVKKIA